VIAEKVRVELSGAPQTMLATLYAKALDTDLDAPILGDRHARKIVERIDYDWSKTSITARNSPSVTIRSAHFDDWAREFLAANPRAVVLHLGCGLDSRYWRLAPGSEVEWYDIDYPDVAELAGTLFPAAGSHHHIVAASVTDPGWLANIPPDRPTLMIGEGLTMYLTEQDGIALLRRLVDRFTSGELQFDAFNRLAIKSQWMNTVVRRSGATLHWGIDRPDDILRAVPGIRLLDWMSVFDAEAFKRTRPAYRVTAHLMSSVPALRYMSSYHRCAF
jgi:O-methyltransferase involved in polyketide biosynthesis